MKKILLIESDYEIMDRLYHIILNHKKNVSIFQTGDLADAYQTVLSHDIELIIVDTSLNKGPFIEMSCLKFIEDIRQFDRYAFVPVIVLSALVDERLHTFRELHCYGYLEKPFSYEAADALIRDALRFKMQKREKRFVYFKSGCVFHPILVSGIAYIEHKRRQMLIHTREGVIDIPYHTCSNTMQQLIDEDFVPCARGTIVNMDFIQSLDGLNRYLVLREGMGQLEVGRSYVKKIKDALQDL